jgi:hypothetical protein
MTPTKTCALWAVMKAHAWNSVTNAHGQPLVCPPDGPHRFIPVFNTREQAVAWDGSDEHVAMLMLNAYVDAPNAAGERLPAKTP